MRLAFFTDVHLSPLAPASRRDEYFNSICRKLSSISDACKALKVDVCLCGGDLFHLKATKPYSLPFLQKFLQVLQSFQSPIYTVVGNHDIKYGNPDSLDEMPLGFFVKLGLIKILNEETFCEKPEKAGDKIPFSVFVRGYHYIASEKELPLSFRPSPPESISIGVVHNFVESGFGKEAFYPIEAVNACDHNILLCGHDHSMKPIRRCNQTIVAQPGAIARNVLNSDSLERQPTLFIITIKVGSNGNLESNFSQMKIPCIPATEAFNLEAKVFEKERTSEVTEVLSQLLRVDGDKVDIHEMMNSMSIRPEIKESVIYFLTLAGVL